MHSSSQSACITGTPLNVSLRINHWLGLFKLLKYKTSMLLKTFSGYFQPVFPAILSCRLCQSCLVPDIVNE